MPQPPDLLCLSHLRWDFVYQRPQHLLSRFARHGRVFFIEEPVEDAPEPRVEIVQRDGVRVIVPHLPAGMDVQQRDAAQRTLIDGIVDRFDIREHVLWYYTPMALNFTRHLRASAVIYDCMDELSAFRFAPPEMLEREAELLRMADLVFTGGHSLYEVKRRRHPNVHPFPSSVDAAHFRAAREATVEPEDQAPISRPRLGYFGVIDERMDLALLEGVATLRPQWQLVLVGPVVKLHPSELPRRPNIHFLGGKSYNDLPSYIAGWDVAIMPFARNDATRYISPTKTPEYLAAGKPVVSTSISDVVRPYGERGLVHIADTSAAFVAAAERAMSEDPQARIAAADTLLSSMSWDRTWTAMQRLIAATIDSRRTRRQSGRVPVAAALPSIPATAPAASVGRS